MRWNNRNASQTTAARAAKRSMHMTEDELNTIVESKLADRLAARLQADRERVRAEVIMELRREADREWYARINARHPIEGPGDPKLEAQRRAAMDARARADMESMDRSNARPVPGSLAATRADRAGGSSGFRIKSGPR
jgi:hypothetical protein